MAPTVSSIGTVFKQDQRAVSLGMTDDPLQSIETGGHPPLFVGGEMEARMHDDPFGAQPWRDFDIGLEITLDGIADIGRHFCDIDRRGGVQAEMHAVSFAGPAHAGGARVVEAAQRIGVGVELDVDPAHFMLCRPLEPLFEPEPAPDVNPDPITQTHQVAPLTAARWHVAFQIQRIDVGR